MNALFVALVLACSPDAKTGETCNHGAAADTTASADFVQRGEKLKGLPSVTLATVLATPAAYDGKTVAVEGKVRRACAKKGCWMELADDDKAPGVRVTFKDYGFFVPVDSAGRTAKVEGTIKVATLAPEKAKHYEAEGATMAKDKDGSAREVQLVAVGVELRK